MVQWKRNDTVSKHYRLKLKQVKQINYPLGVVSYFFLFFLFTFVCVCVCVCVCVRACVRAYVRAGARMRISMITSSLLTCTSQYVDIILGPVLFTLYIQPLSEVISRSRCGCHKFADDTQLDQSSSAPSDFHSLIVDIEQCVDSVG